MRILVIHPGAGTSTSDVHDGYVRSLERAGHEVKVFDLSSRIERAGAWLQFNYRRSNKDEVPKPTPADILYWAGTWSIEMALRIQPDWIIVNSGMFFLKDTMILLRRATRSFAHMALICTESPYDDAAQLQVVPIFDVVFTNERVSVNYLKTTNPNTFYLPHAYDPDKHYPATPKPETPVHDVVFVGTGFRERLELLSKIDWSGINLGLYGTYNMLGPRSNLREHIRGGPIGNEQTVELYRAAKIGLNIHRQSMGFSRNAPRITHALSLNPRAYEIAATGVFQISDNRAELGPIFGEFVPTFETPKQLEETIWAYIENDRLRNAMARGARDAVAKHTFDSRAAFVIEVLEHYGRISAA